MLFESLLLKKFLTVSTLEESHFKKNVQNTVIIHFINCIQIQRYHVFPVKKGTVTKTVTKDLMEFKPKMPLGALQRLF